MCVAVCVVDCVRVCEFVCSCGVFWLWLVDNYFACSPVRLFDWWCANVRWLCVCAAGWSFGMSCLVARVSGCLFVCVCVCWFVCVLVCLCLFICVGLVVRLFARVFV